MSPKFTRALEDCVGRLMEKMVDVAELLCPPLKKFLSWEFDDDGSLFAIHDEDTTPPQTKISYGASQDYSALCKERGHFARHAASAA